MTLDGTRVREDGALLANARVARTGIQTYAGFEVGRPTVDVVRVYRPGREVFSDATLASFAHRPVTNDHPDELVTAETWKDVAVGQTAGDVLAEERFIRIPLMVSDADAIADIQGGKRELSAGYTCDLVFQDGVTESGEAYDAIQTNIRANHVAIVRRGRAGEEVRIGDDAGKGGLPRQSWGAAPITLSDKPKETNMSTELKNVVLGDKAVQVAVSDASEVEKFKAETSKALSDAKASHKAAMDAKDADIATKDAEIEDLKSKVLDADALDALVANRSALIADAKLVDKDVETAGKSEAEIRRAVVGDVGKDKSDAYVDARFDIMVESAKSKDGGSDAFRDAAQKKPKVNLNDADAAYHAMVADISNPKKGGA